MGAEEVVSAIRSGDVESLRRLLRQRPDLVRTRIDGRSLLHVVTDWPGNLPNGPAMVSALVEAGADVNARFEGAHTETPLHWAASSDDVDVIDGLLDAGADIDASGGVIGSGTPLSDAVAFGQWRAARRLVERGATPTLREAAALGLMNRVESAWSAAAPPSPDQVTQAFWYACHGGHQEVAGYLLARGADINWVSTWDGRTPLEAAERSGATGVAAWLRSAGAHPAPD